MRFSYYAPVVVCSSQLPKTLEMNQLPLNGDEHYALTYLVDTYLKEQKEYASDSSNLMFVELAEKLKKHEPVMKVCEHCGSSYWPDSE